MCVAEKPPNLISRGTGRTRASLGTCKDGLIDFRQPSREASSQVACSRQEATAADRHTPWGAACGHGGQLRGHSEGERAHHCGHACHGYKA
eukprot:12535709-Alexandrium_andersonii.AAC.1